MAARKRILVMASGGGHWVQLQRLKAAWAEHDVTWATVHADSAADVAPAKFRTFTDVSRKDWWRLPLVVADMARLLLAVRPQVIVSTGALPPLVAMALARPFGVRTLWVDSIANSEVVSGSGRLAKKVAGQVVTQWPGLAGDGIEHWGSVL